MKAQVSDLLLNMAHLCCIENLSVAEETNIGRN